MSWRSWRLSPQLALAALCFLAGVVILYRTFARPAPAAPGETAATPTLTAGIVVVPEEPPATITPAASPLPAAQAYPPLEPVVPTASPTEPPPPTAAVEAPAETADAEPTAAPDLTADAQPSPTAPS